MDKIKYKIEEKGLKVACLYFKHGKLKKKTNSVIKIYKYTDAIIRQWKEQTKDQCEGPIHLVMYTGQVVGPSTTPEQWLKGLDEPVQFLETDYEAVADTLCMVVGQNTTPEEWFNRYLKKGVQFSRLTTKQLPYVMYGKDFKEAVLEQWRSRVEETLEGPIHLVTSTGQVVGQNTTPEEWFNRYLKKGVQFSRLTTKQLPYVMYGKDFKEAVLEQWRSRVEETLEGPIHLVTSTGQVVGQNTTPEEWFNRYLKKGVQFSRLTTKQLPYVMYGKDFKVLVYKYKEAVLEQWRSRVEETLEGPIHLVTSTGQVVGQNTTPEEWFNRYLKKGVQFSRLTTKQLPYVMYGKDFKVLVYKYKEAVLEQWRSRVEETLEGPIHLVTSTGQVVGQNTTPEEWFNRYLKKGVQFSRLTTKQLPYVMYGKDFKVLVYKYKEAVLEQWRSRVEETLEGPIHLVTSTGQVVGQNTTPEEWFNRYLKKGVQFSRLTTKQLPYVMYGKDFKVLVYKYKEAVLEQWRSRVEETLEGPIHLVTSTGQVVGQNTTPEEWFNRYLKKGVQFSRLTTKQLPYVMYGKDFKEAVLEQWRSRVEETLEGPIHLVTSTGQVVGQNTTPEEWFNRYLKKGVQFSRLTTKQLPYVMYGKDFKVLVYKYKEAVLEQWRSRVEETLEGPIHLVTSTGQVVGQNTTPEEWFNRYLKKGVQFSRLTTKQLPYVMYGKDFKVLVYKYKEAVLEQWRSRVEETLEGPIHLVTSTGQVVGQNTTPEEWFNRYLKKGVQFSRLTTKQLPYVMYGKDFKVLVYKYKEAVLEQWRSRVEETLEGPIHLVTSTGQVVGQNTTPEEWFNRYLKKGVQFSRLTTKQLPYVMYGKDFKAFLDNSTTFTNQPIEDDDDDEDDKTPGYSKMTKMGILKKVPKIILMAVRQCCNLPKGPIHLVTYSGLVVNCQTLYNQGRNYKTFLDNSTTFTNQPIEDDDDDEDDKVRSREDNLSPINGQLC
ncbi:hypothetical protein OS493_036516 [Desmophyllum pertusum]|uniref:Uncharacterized protein n=1 Tax=Desmophyllum pertusum TaxID=174260 RepID=A0A9X0D611_9CNID|nr:hypothetical protein OS493_036516 [Desmophyllum pertusum]